MRLFVLGATGRTGAQILELALARGHDVTAFVRSPAKLAPGAPSLKIVGGDVRDRPALAAALRGHDAVLSAIGPHPRDALRPGTTLMADSAASTVAAMKSAGVARIAVVSAAVLFPEKGLFFAFFRWVLRHHARDLSAMEAVLRAADVDWTIARPPRLTRSPAQAFRALPGALPPGSRLISSRAVAAFMLDAVERGVFGREIVGLGRGLES